MPLKTVSENERRAIFTQVASEIGIRPDMIEKDYWVSWVLNKIFEHEKLKTILLFKGGTSLSKAFQAINRFSEDIDLLLDLICMKLPGRMNLLIKKEHAMRSILSSPKRAKILKCMLRRI